MRYKSSSLKDLISFISKGIVPKYANSYDENVIRVINQRCNRNGEITFKEARYSDLSKRKVTNEKLLKNKDILINSTGKGTAGRVAQISENQLTEPTTVDGHMIIIRPSEKIDPDYLGYALKAQQRVIESYAEGSTGQTEINKQRLLDETIIKYPSKEEQRKIANIFINLDMKIKNNQKINTNLLELLDAEFTNQFINSDLPIGKVNDFVSIKRGSSPRPIKNFLSDKGRAWIKISDVTKLTSPFLYDTAQSIKESGIDKSRTIKPGTLILSNSATPGIPIISEILASVHDGWLIVDHYTHMDRNWFYLFFRQMRRQLIARANGSVFNNLKTDIVKDFPVPIAKEEELLKFKRISNPIFDKLDKLQQENIVLSKLKDILLKQYF